MNHHAEPILRIEGLTHRYGQHVALDRLNLSVRPGEVFGYIGPNGAGKTTTFRILAGLLRPTEGRAVIAGQDVTGDKDQIKRLVGYLPDNFGVYPTLKVWEYLDFFGAAFRIPKKRRGERIETCLRIANAGEFADKLMGALSRGMKQRVGIAKTLLHDPQVLILDEPAATLDPRARVQMRELLRQLAALDKAVLVSSHILPELADVCDSVGILSAGKLVVCGPIDQVTQSVRQQRVIEIRLSDGSSAAKARRVVPPEWQAMETSGGENVLRFESQGDEAELKEVLCQLIQAGVPVVSFHEIPADLEDVFMGVTREAASQADLVI